MIDVWSMRKYGSFSFGAYAWWGRGGPLLTVYLGWLVIQIPGVPERDRTDNR